MGNKLYQIVMVLCLSLVLMPLSGNAKESSAKLAANQDAAAEEKARRFFTDLEVVDQNGHAQRFYSDVLKDRVVLISFIFTNCEGACPMVAQKLKQTRSMMVESIKDEVWFVSISIDPERDTPEAMRQFAERQGVDDKRWIFLTGDQQNLETIVRKLGQYTPDIESHTTLMLAGNTKTKHWMRVMPMVPPEGIAQKMRSLVEETPG